MPNLSEFLRNYGGITQYNHVPREGFRLEWLEEVMNPVPIILGTPTKLEDMQESLWLPTKRASKIGSPNMLKPRPKGKTLEGQTPSKMGNLGFGDNTPYSVKAFSPLRKGRLQMPPLIEHIHHRQVGRKSCIAQTWLIIEKWSGKILLLIMPPSLTN